MRPKIKVLEYDLDQVFNGDRVFLDDLQLRIRYELLQKRRELNGLIQWLGNGKRVK